ncbi:Transcription elongation factor SPT6 homolog, partial [Linum perenne]
LSSNTLNGVRSRSRATGHSLLLSYQEAFSRSRNPNFAKMGRHVISDEEDERELDDDEREPMEGDAADDDEEEDEEGQDEYEKDDFIVDDVEEEPEEEDRVDSDEEKQRKRKKKKKRETEDVLDDEDYELLLDNNAIQRRPKVDSKKFKRLKKAQRETDGDGNDFSDEELDGSGKGGRTAEEKIKRSLFGDYEGNNLEDIPEEEERIEEEEDVEEDEMADFIVEEDEIDEHGLPVRHKKVKKKKSRQASGASSSALQEAHEIFGDVDELLQLRKQQGLDSNEWRERRLEDEFEPSVLSEKYMTEKDDEIKQTDIPERMQILEESTGPPPTNADSIDDESTWIYNQLATGAAALQGVTINKDDIGRFLEFHHVQKLDIPFIATYRKDECFSLFKDPGQLESDYDNQDNDDQPPKLKWHKVLSAIQDLDRKWLLLQKRKSALRLYYHKRYEEEAMRIYDETRLNLNQRLFKSIIKSLEASESEREIDDVDSKFNLHFPPGEVGANEGQFKRPKRRSLFSTCNKAGLWEVASKFGRSAEQLGLHLSLLEMGDALEDAKEAPEEMASNFTCAMFETPLAVLKGARHMAAVEISCEPYVRKHVRAAYMENAVVSTSPTSDGNTTIDSFHQFYGVKWLREKPVSEFKDAQWLLIQKAEEDKLLQVTFKLPEKRMEELVTECKEHYLSDGVSKSAQLWNEQRQLILQDALFVFLLPSMEKEARSLLTSRAKRWLLWEYGQVLWNKVSVGPYQRKENDRSSDDEAAPRVMACCWGSGKPATTFVMLDSAGEVLDVLYTGSLTLRSQNVDDQQRKKNDQQRVLKFMMDHQPHVVVLGAVNLSCTRLKEDIYEIIFKMVEENPRDVGQDMDELNIVYGDESLPRLYENSRVSSDQLPTQSGIVKKAVALGRYLQNPLAMAATLCGPEREILSWKLNPLENFLTPDEKYAMVEQVMVDVTNQVGFDVNLAIGHEWLFAPLQFISGLGPRKAASLQRSLVRAGGIYTRKDFVTMHDLGKKVFVNAVGFLRVRRSGLEEEFYMISGETEDTIAEGRIVQATVRRVPGMKAICALESGLTGILMKDDYDDDSRDISELSDRLREGDILTCRIKSIQMNRYQVYLACKESEIRNNRYQPVRDLDPYFHEDTVNLQSDQEKARKEKELAKKHFKPRMIVHPRFQNITADEAMEVHIDQVYVF